MLLSSSKGVWTATQPYVWLTSASSRSRMHARAKARKASWQQRQSTRLRPCARSARARGRIGGEQASAKRASGERMRWGAGKQRQRQYVLYGQHSKAAQGTTLPWYTQKEAVTFSDMLATLRRASWRARLFAPGASVSDLRKRMRPLVDYVAT